MIKHLLFAPFYFISFLAAAQQISAIDFDQIKIEVEDTSSRFYYPKLVKRMTSKDTTLSSQDYKHLYYGNVFQDYYHPYGATENQKLFVEAYNTNESEEKIEKLGFAVLAENPVNLGVLLKMIFLYNKSKSVEKATVFAKMYVSFLEVIYASGTGKDCENAFVVISVDDEYRITADLGLTVIKQALIGSCDRLTFSKKAQKRKNRIKGLFFNVRMPLSYLSKSYNKSDLPLPDANPDEEE